MDASSIIRSGGAGVVADDNVVGEGIRKVIGSFGGRHLFSSFDVLRQGQHGYSSLERQLNRPDSDSTLSDWRRGVPVSTTLQLKISFGPSLILQT